MSVTRPGATMPRSMLHSLRRIARSRPRAREAPPVRAHSPPAVSELRALVRSARPDLSDDSPESRGAVLLLMIPDTGPNVDRLALRTGFSRAFVAQCLRRLIDNALWFDGELPPYLRADAVSGPELWLDVEVALGRRLRRVGEDGRPEWARAGDWVKDFEYAGREPSATPVHTAYREIAPHDPEPVAPEPEDEADPAEEPETGQTDASPGPPSAARSTGLLVESWARAEWLR